MPTAEKPRQLSSADRRAIYAEQYGRVLSGFTPNCDGNRYSGAQVARAKGIARKQALKIISDITGEGWE